MIRGLKKTTFITVSSSKKPVCNVTLELLCYGIERKMGVILRCKLATRNESMSKLPCVSLFHILSAMFLPHIIWIGLQLGNLSQKYKGWTYFWHTAYSKPGYVSI